MMKKILIITDNLPDQINGVVTTYTNIESLALNDGYSIDYIDPSLFRFVDCPIYNEVKLAYPRKMGKKIKQFDPDHIHIATEGPVGLWARAYLSKRGIRYNTAYHTRFPEGLKTLMGLPENMTWRYIKWFHKHTGHVLTTTRTLANELKQHGLVADIIPWTRGVDRSTFRPELRNRTDSTINLVCVSRVSKEKNLEDFFRIQYPNSRKIMVGDGPMRVRYQAEYKDVEFVGFKTGVALAEYFANADVFVFPSRWETFGLVMIEAMACATPVAAYPVSGPLDVIDEGITGYMHIDLNQAIARALTLDRHSVYKGSLRWTWEEAWNIFKENLVEAK